MRSKASVATLVLALALAGCGASEKGHSTSTSHTAAPVTTTMTPTTTAPSAVRARTIANCEAHGNSPALCGCVYERVASSKGVAAIENGGATVGDFEEAEAACGKVKP